jgi:hypothetical protein
MTVKAKPVTGPSFFRMARARVEESAPDRHATNTPSPDANLHSYPASFAKLNVHNTPLLLGSGCARGPGIVASVASRCGS